MKRHRHSSAIVLGLSLLLSSCAFADAPGAAAHAAPQQRAMTRAVAKPNGSAIDVQYVVEGSPQIGRRTAVTLRFDGITDPAGGSVRFGADPGLALTAEGRVPLPVGAVTTVTVHVVPGSEGIAYLHVFTAQNGATSAISVPIRVGKTAPALRSSGDLRKTPSGEAVISMPAR